MGRVKLQCRTGALRCHKMAVMDMSVLWIAACAVCGTVLALLFWHRARAGPVILDLGGRNRTLWTTDAVICSLFAVAAIVEWFGHRAKSICPAVLGAEMAILCLSQLTWDLQIRENGIFRDGHLVPWSRLKSYRWEVPTNTVLIDRQSAMPWLRRFSFRVADESTIPKVDAILRTRIAVPLSATSALPLNRQAD